jgi:hypothetical protein
VELAALLLRQDDAEKMTDAQMAPDGRSREHALPVPVVRYAAQAAPWGRVERFAAQAAPWAPAQAAPWVRGAPSVPAAEVPRRADCLVLLLPSCRALPMLRL